MTDAKRSTVVLGREFDQSLRADLKIVLNDLGAVFGQVRWRMGGSQEMESVMVVVRGESLLVEAETYIGLSITGPEQLIAEIRELLKAKRVR